MADLNAIKEKIRKLREMNPARGCTEAEAEAAAAAAMRLMTEYGLSVDDVEYGEITLDTFAPRRHVADAVWGTVAHVCRCTGTFRRDMPRLAITYHGRLSDILVVEYLHQLVLGALRRGAQDFRASDYYRRRRLPRTRAQALKTFLDGMASGMDASLMQLWWRSVKDDRDAQEAHSRAIEAAGAARSRRMRIRDSRALAAPKGDKSVREAGVVRGMRTRLDPAAAGVATDTKRIGGA